MDAIRYLTKEAAEFAYSLHRNEALDDTVAHAVQVGDVLDKICIEAYLPEGAEWAILAVNNNKFATITPAEWHELYEFCAFNENRLESPDQARTLELAEKWVNSKMHELVFFYISDDTGMTVQ